MRRLTIVLLCALTVSAQQTPTHTGAVYVTAIDVVADVRDKAGNLPPGLTPDDFVLVEDGVERRVIGVEYLSVDAAATTTQTGAASPSAPSKKPWQTLLYFETDLSHGSGRRQTAKELMKHADRLVQMGTVDVVLATPTPKALLKNSRDAEEVRKALQVVASGAGNNQIAMQRMDFLHHVQSNTQVEAVRQSEELWVADVQNETVKKVTAPVMPSKSNMSSRVTMVDVKVVRPYVEQEVQLVNRFRRNLVGWLSNYSRYAPRTLIMVTDGYDIDPLEYYNANLNKGDAMELQSYVQQASLSDSAAKMAKALATAGWTTVSVQGNTFSDGWIDDASSTSGVGRVHKFGLAEQQTGPRAILLRPADPLREVAEETGGEVVPNSGKIARAIDKMDDRLRITYQVDRKPDGKARKIELRARDEKLKVRGARWAASSTSDEMAEQRTLGQLQEGAFLGDLPVDATVEWSANTARKQGTLRVVSKIPGLANPTSGDFRFTLAVQVPPKEAFVTSRPLDGFRMTDSVFNLKTPLDLPAATSVIVISIEEMSTGMWGSARIEVK